VSQEIGRVLDEHDGRLALIDDAHEFGPERTLIGVSEALAGQAVWLARDARSDAIHEAAPRAAIEGRDIVPDRREIQGLLFHPRHESGCCVGIPLDVTHHAVASCGRNSQSELKPANPGTYSQPTHTLLAMLLRGRALPLGLLLAMPGEPRGIAPHVLDGRVLRGSVLWTEQYPSTLLSEGVKVAAAAGVAGRHVSILGA
jgi:hypothetical protein